MKYPEEKRTLKNKKQDQRTTEMNRIFRENNTSHAILINILIAFVSLFLNGFGVYLTIHANIGSAPWDVLNLGLSKTFGVLYGTASITVSLLVLGVDIALKEPIGIAMLIDALTVGKSVDFFDWINIVPIPKTLLGSIFMTFVGLFIIGYTQYFYMRAALGCGPRDTLLVGITKHIKKMPIGLISIFMQSIVTFTGYLLGGAVGIGTIICAFCAGPIMQFAFNTFSYDATGIKHQNIVESVKIFAKKKNT